MAIEELLVKISGDATNLISALGKANSNVSDFTKGVDKIGKTMTAIGGAVTAAFGLIINQAVNAGDAFNDMSMRTGVSVEALSALAYAAKQTGTDIDAIELSLKFLTRAMDDTSKGTGTAKDTFKALGISVTDTNGKLRPTIEVMKDVATRIASINDPARQAALAMELFGARSGTQLLPLLKLGEGGINSLMEKAKELGIVMSTESAQAADEFKDSMTTLKDSLGGVGKDIANVLIPPLMDLVNWAIEIVKRVREWADAHKPLVEMLVKVAAGVGVFLAIVGPIILATSAFLKLAPAITAVRTALTLLLTGSPFGLIIAAVAIFVVAYQKNFLGLKTFIDQVIGGIIKAYDWYIEKTTKYVNIANGFLAKLGLVKVKGWADFRKDVEDVGFAIDPVIKKVDTFNGVIGTGIPITKEQSDAVKNLAEANKTLGDRIYELTHTEMENNIKKLYEQAQAYTDMGVPMKDVAKWVDLEQEAMYKLDIVLNKVTNSWADFRKMDSSGMLADNATKLQTLANGFKSINTDLDNLNKTGLQIAISNLEKMAEQFIKDGQNAELVAKWLKAMKGELISLDAAQNNAKKSAADFWKMESEGAIKTGEAVKTLGRGWKEYFDNIKTSAGTTFSILTEAITNFTDGFKSALGNAITSLLTMGATNKKIKEEMAAENATYLTDEAAAQAVYNAAVMAGDKVKTAEALANLETIKKKHQETLDAMADKQVTFKSVWASFWDALKQAAINALAALAASWIWKLILWILPFNKGGGVGYDMGGAVKLATGGIAKFASGGLGTDTVPAMLTPGEYVIAKPMTDFIKKFKMIPANLISAISMGAQTPVPAFANGGSVGNSSVTSMGYGYTFFNVDIHDNKISDDVDVKKLANVVGDEILKRINMNRRH